LADAFTAIADVFELVGARAKPIERTHGVTELERVLGPKPKHPLTISKLYHLDHAKAMSAQNPDLNSKEVKKLIVVQWENISEEERQTYRDRYSALKRQYKIDFAAYDARRKAFMQTRSGGFVSTAQFSEPHSPTLSVSPGPPPEPERSSTPILPSSPFQPTVRFTEPQRSTLFLSPRPSLQPPLHQPQLRPILSTLPGPVTQLAVRLTEPERSTLFTSPGPPLKSSKRLSEDEVVERELGPSPKPPAPASRMYCESMTKDILKENPRTPSIEAVRLAHVRWNSLSEEDRQPLNDRFDALKRQYDIDIAEYNARKDAFLSTYRELLSTVRLAESEPITLSISPGPVSQPSKRLSEDEVVERELGPSPKPPAPASRMYCESMTKDILKENPRTPSIEAVRLAHVRWNSLSEEDRQPLNDRFDALKRQYDIDIAEYNARKDVFLSSYNGSVSTARLAEPGPSTLSISPDPSPQPPARLAESERLTLSLSPGPPLKPTEQLYEDEVVERELGPKPKHPTSTQDIYRRDAVKDIRKENPEVHWKDAQSLADIRWKSLSEEDRQPFRDRHHALSKQYKIDIAAYSARKKAFLSTYNGSVSTARLAEPEHPTSPTLPGLPPQPTERRNEPECTMAFMLSRFNGLLSSPPPPPPVESFGSSRPTGPPVPSQSTLPSGTVSRPLNHSGLPSSVGPPDVAALAHSLAMSWSAEATLPGESPESTSLPFSSGSLPRPTMASEHSISPILASAAATANLVQPAIPLESIPVGMRPIPLEFPNTTETVTFVESPALPFSTDHPAPETASPACAIPVNPVENVEPAEPLTPTKTKSKKKKKRAAEDDVQESTSPQRTKAKRAKGDMREGNKKHKPKIVVKTEDNVEEAMTNKESNNMVMDIVAQMPMSVVEQSAIPTA
ncbi:hypothetical protein GGH93_002018, partial [Coemansia aciculifera]